MKPQRVESPLDNDSQPEAHIRIIWASFSKYIGHLTVKLPKEVV